MPFTPSNLPAIPGKIDVRLCVGYFTKQQHPQKTIDTAPQFYDLQHADIVEAVNATEAAIQAAGYWVAPSPTVYAGAKRAGYRRHLAVLLGQWLVQRETVAHLLPDFWVYACIKVQHQPAFLTYIEEALAYEYKTQQVWDSLVKDSAADVRYFLTVGQVPSL